jgi:uncharacterized protein
VVDAVSAGRRHVRHPKRAIIFPLLAEAPRRTVEVLLTGIRSRDEVAAGAGPVIDLRDDRAADLGQETTP